MKTQHPTTFRLRRAMPVTPPDPVWPGRALLLASVLAAGTLTRCPAFRPAGAHRPRRVRCPRGRGHPPGPPGPGAGGLPPNAAAPTGAEAAGTNGLRLNFRNAPIDLVLNYLSDAAGFIIELDTPVRGNVSVISSHPMTADEAVDLVNSVLNKNGYAAIRNGRTLTILDKNDAKTRDIPVKVSNDPDSIPKNDEIVTQIIPIRFVEARQLVTDLSPFVSPRRPSWRTKPATRL